MAKNEGGHELKDIGKDLGNKAAEVARETYDDVKEKAGEVYEEGVEKTRELAAYLADTIREKPIQSVLIGAGVGLLIGRFRVRPFESMILAAGTGLACGLLWSSSELGKGRSQPRKRSRQ